MMVLAAGCANPDAERDSAGGAADEARALSEIQATARLFSASYVAGDIDSLATFYTNDGVAASGNGDFVRGRPAIDSMWVLPPGRSVLCHVTRAERLEVRGDVAYDWGYYGGQAAQDGVPLAPFAGKYVIVWERGDDGRWRMAVDVWSRSPAADELTLCPDAAS